MRLTQHTDLAFRVLIYLAVNGPERSTIQTIAKAYDISHNHLMKVVHHLVQLGYVHSIRGAGGGIELARAPDQIRLGELVSKMEPDFALVECFRPDNKCVITSACTLPALLDEAVRAFQASLDRHTLAELTPRNSHTRLRMLLRI